MTEAAKNGTVSTSALRRQREREQRYQTILSVAENLFSTEGYHATSMDRIAQAAEVSVGTLYFYFKNKEDLLVQLLSDIGFRIRELVGSEFIRSDATLVGFEQAGLSFFTQFCVKHPEKITIFFRESVGQGQAVEAMRKKIFKKFTADIVGALERLSKKLGVTFRSGLSTEVMAVSIVGMYEKVAYQYLIWNDRSDELQRVAEDALAFIVGGVKNLCKE
ncbi:MAG: TetR/AcrR family transcriptional regulator [Deltaproteobacteria bacterium]|nr:TetR/AcrR family transcriptional regulator [Deltaproteobacteria bacterium]